MDSIVVIEEYKNTQTGETEMKEVVAVLCAN